MAAAQAGDPATLVGVLSRQRALLLKELHSLGEARIQAPSPVVALLITAAELHVRADLGVVDAAEETFASKYRTARRAAHTRNQAGRHDAYDTAADGG